VPNRVGRRRRRQSFLAGTVKRLAVIAGVLSVATVAGGLGAFSAADVGYSTSSLMLIAIGYLTSSIIALVGWLLVRAPWGRWSLVAAVSGSLLLASPLNSAFVYLVYATGATAIIILAGPWMTLWARQFEPPGGPNRVALALIVAGPLSPLVVGLAAYDTAHWAHWLAAFTSLIGSWAYGRGLPLAVWLLRIAVPMTSVAAFISSPTPNRFILVAGATFVTILAWLPGATQTSTFPNPPLPSPRPQRRETSDATD
jgi:hypothetical protein